MVDMRDNGKGLERVGDESEESDAKRLGRKKRSKSCSVVLSAIYHYVQQIYNFAGSSRVANDRAENEGRG